MNNRMKKTLLIIASLVLVGIILLFIFGEANLDINLLTGTAFSPAPEPKPSDPGEGYYDEYQSDDNGAGLASFSTSAYLEKSLPNKNRGTASVFSGCTDEEVTILEGSKLDISDKNLKDAIDEIKNQLKNDEKFKEFSFLIISLPQKIVENHIKIKLNDTYKGKTAYFFYVDTHGAIKKLQKDSDKDYIPYTLDEKNLVNNILDVDLDNQTGYFIYCFGAN